MKQLFSLALLTASVASAAPPITGLWDGKVTANGVAVPFRVQFAGSGSRFSAWFFNGDERR